MTSGAVDNCYEIQLSIFCGPKLHTESDWMTYFVKLATSEYEQVEKYKAGNTEQVGVIVAADLT